MTSNDPSVFHVELRQFPHNTHAFNLTEAELLGLAVPWAHERWVELGERRWSPNQARMTVLEGPRLEVSELALGRGWRNAERAGVDVTERVLARARASRPPEPVGASEPSAPGTAPTAAHAASLPQPAEADLRPLLGGDPEALLRAWRLASERRPELSPSESLALAEATLRALDSDPSQAR